MMTPLLRRVWLSLAFAPIGCLLIAQSWAWPRNWDDMHRGFNGIDPNHNLINYGIQQSEYMLKLLIHDPTLTWANQFDYRFPLLSGITEVALLVSFMVLCTALAIQSSKTMLAIILIIAFNLLVGVQATTFLPPAAYPIGFSLFFLITVIGNVRFDSTAYSSPIEFVNNSQYLNKSQSTLRATCSLALVIGEQLGFLFYACNFLQSMLFWGLGIVYMLGRRMNSLSTPSFHLHLSAGIRYLPFIIVTFIWRFFHEGNNTEALSPHLSGAALFLGSLRWSLAGTSAGGFAQMMPPYKLPWALPFPIIIGAALYAILTVYLGFHVLTNKYFQLKTSARSSRVYTLYILGVSIVLGWSLPVLSNRYFDELLNDQTQTYAASRYAALGLIVLLSCLLSQAIKPWSQNVASVYCLALALGIAFGSQSISSTITNIKQPSLRLHEVCIGRAQWDQELYLTKDVFTTGVNTAGWLTGFPESEKDSSLESKRGLAMKIFSDNSARYCSTFHN